MYVCMCMRYRAFTCPSGFYPALRALPVIFKGLRPYCFQQPPPWNLSQIWLNSSAWGRFEPRRVRTTGKINSVVLCFESRRVNFLGLGV